MRVAGFGRFALVTALSGCLSAAGPASAQAPGGEGAGSAAKPPPRAYMMRADKDGDDLVSRDEYVADASRRFVRLDADKDGTVTRSEVEKAAARIAARIRARMLKEFAGNDADEDGKFLKAEADLKAGVRFAELDANADGKLASADFMNARAGRRRKPASGGSAD
jgi:EF hand